MPKVTKPHIKLQRSALIRGRRYWTIENDPAEGFEKLWTAAWHFIGRLENNRLKQK